MEFYDVIENRHTIRQFDDREVEQEKVNRIIEAGIKAPSDDHYRNIEYIIIKNKNVKKELINAVKNVDWNKKEPSNKAEEMYNIALHRQKSMLEEAKVIIVPVYKVRVPIEKATNVTHLNPHASVWCTIENMFLAITNEGLSNAMHVPVGSEVDGIKKAVGCPDNYEVPVIIGIGYAKEMAEIPSQFEFKAEEKIHIDKF